ncbi:MAG: hypothetical protein JXA91_00500 [Candidatus Thermoplasmatota archaeon]|nr:hypothetical protein [Candidatus Thermoplasmatota archaeon]
MDISFDMQTILILLQTIILIITAILTYVIFKISIRIGSITESDKIFMEIEKILLKDKNLHEFYNVGDKNYTDFWQKCNDKERRLYIFCEMNYFLFAAVYREHKRRVLKKDYWEIYKNWLLKLLRDQDMFLILYLFERDHFELEFRDEMEKIIKEEIEKNVNFRKKIEGFKSKYNIKFLF